MTIEQVPHNRLQGVPVKEEHNFLSDLGDAITDKLEEFVRRITPKEKRYAPFLQFVDSATIPANTLAVLRLQGPTRGRFWYVRKLRLSGLTPISASSNNEYTFSGASNGTATPVITAGGTLQSISFVLNTDATVVNRTVVVSILEANNRVLYQVVSPFNQTASLSTEYSLGAGITMSANGTPVSVTMPLPAGLVVPPGGKVSITTQGGVAGDTISSGTVTLTGTSRADIFICPDDLRSITTLAQCPIGSWKDQFTTIPQVLSYGVGELRVGPQEALYVAVSNGALAAQTLVASCEAYEWPDVDENVEWVM